MWTDFDEYVQELTLNKEVIPHHIFELATNVERHELSNASSLHDAWLDLFSVREVRKAKRDFDCKLIISLKLLGQKHDRYILMTYDPVVSHEFVAKMNSYNHNDTFHGDILKHGISVLGENLFLHEIEFSSGSKLNIKFKDLKIEEELI